jgi:hypothetical protein
MLQIEKLQNENFTLVIGGESLEAHRDWQTNGGKRMNGRDQEELVKGAVDSCQVARHLSKCKSERYPTKEPLAVAISLLPSADEAIEVQLVLGAVVRVHSCAGAKVAITRTKPPAAEAIGYLIVIFCFCSMVGMVVLAVNLSGISGLLLVRSRVQCKVNLKSVLFVGFR